MGVFVTSLTLGSLYCLIAIVLVLHFKVSGFLNIGVLGYIALAPYIVSEFTSENSPLLLYLLVCLAVMVLISVLNFAIDFALFKPISRLSGSMKVIVSICVLFIILTIVDIVWPSGANLESPVGTKSFPFLGTDVLWIDLITIITALAVVFGLFFVLSRTIAGNRLLAYAGDKHTARAYGISPLYVRILTSLFTGVMVTLAGVLLASPGSPRAGVTSVIFYSLIALSPVIVARHSDLIICLIASFVIAFAQTFSSANLNAINDSFQSFVSFFGVSTQATLGPTFADRFIPFAIALLALVIIPTRWIRDDANG